MSRGFVKEGDQEEVPMVLPRAFLPKGTPNYVTPEGLKKLHDEMKTLKKQWTDAGSNYVTKNYLDAKMLQLSERINTAVLIDPSKSNPDVVSFGMYVKYNDKVIRIVGVDEADASKGLVSFISPIAKALIGKKKGDKFEIKVPKGTETVEILEISHRFTETLSRRVETHQLHRKNKQDVIDTSEKNKVPNDTSDESVQSSCRDALNASKSESSSESSSEFLPLVNEQGNIIGRALSFEIHGSNKLLHPAVHLLVYNSKKEIVAKYCWHVAFGETAEKTLKRKLKEIESQVETYGRMSQTIKPKFDKRYIREDKNEKELVSVFTAIFDGEVSFSSK